MTIDALRRACARLGIRLVVDTGQLKVRAPAGVVTAELREALTRHKVELLGLLGGPHDEIAPLSAAQRSLWLLHQGDPGSLPAYNIRAARRFRGPLQADRLEQALGAVVARHEPLRAAFVEHEGEPWQRIASELEVRIKRVDVSQLSAAEREWAWERELQREGERAFVLGQQPLFSVTLFRLAAEEHVLLLNAHHLIADAWSAGLLLREVASVYADRVNTRPQEIRPLAFHFSDHVVLQEREAESNGGRAALQYWQERLAGLPALQLPTDAPRRGGPTYAGASESFSLPSALGQELRDLARAEGVTLFHALVASYAVLLQRLSGQNDFGIGTTLAGRETRESESLVGYFVNLVVLRPRLDDAPSFRELLRRTRSESLGAFQHQAAPFDRVVRALRLPRDHGVAPLFQVLFLYLQAGRDAAVFPGLETEVLAVPSTTSKYDLSLHIEDHGERLAGLIEYNVALFTAVTIRRFIDTWQELLRGLVAAPDVPAERVSALSEVELRRVVSGFNATPLAPVFSGGVAQQFQAQVRQTPEAVALVCEEWSISYAGLDRLSDRFAERLREAGVGPERWVGVAVERSPELLVALLAILKTGGAYVPLDPGYPAERLGFMVEDARPVVLLTSRGLAGFLPDHGVARIFVDGIADEPNPGAAKSEPLARAAEALPDQAAYVIYTSGSTGRPKGVVVTHGNVVNFFAGMDEQLGRGPGVWLAATSISFDISVLELFWTLARGFKVVLHPDELKGGIAGTTSLKRTPNDSLVAEARPRRTLAEQFVHHAPTHFQATPSRVKMLLLDPGMPESLGTLDRLIIGGEAVTLTLATELAARAQGEVHNLYGPTETTVWSTGHRVARDDARVLIGRPLTQQQVYVLDSHLQLLPVGVAGELYIGGAGVTRGYLGRPELTAERFVPDPFGAIGGRLYRTGDLARWREDGNVECLGRADHQVKILGHRIEPGEIETMLAKHPGLEAVAVTAPLGPDGERRLVAYGVRKQGAKPSEVEPALLRTWLRERLPEHLVPAVYVSLDALPLTPNGKVDRRALPAPETIAPLASGDSFVEPRSAGERLVARIWETLLALPRVGTQDNFFELGGHSLLAMQMLARLRAATGVNLQLRAVFETPTLGALAARLGSPETAEELPGEKPAELALAPRDGSSQPLSLAQRRLWFIEQLEPGRATYNMPAAIRLRGRCDTAALRESLADLVRRHEALRTRFPALNGEPVQEVLPAAAVDFVLPEEAMYGESRADREERAWRRVEEEAQIPFDLGHGPLLRARLLRLEHEDHLLVFVIHHLVSDAWTMGLLTRELTAFYEARVAGRVVGLPGLAAHYVDFSAWQRSQLQTEALRVPLAFWKTYLAGAVATEIPSDRARPRLLAGDGREFRFVWSADLVLALNRLAQREGATLFMTLLAGYYALLARYTRQDDLVVGTTVANRARPEFEAMAGFFVNMLPIRVDTRGNPTFTDLLARVKQACLAAYTHQETPFEALVEAVAPERDLGRTPLFQTMLVLLNTPAATARLAGLEISMHPVENRTAKFDLTLLGSEVGGELHWTAEYRTSLYPQTSVARLADHLHRLLAGAAASPGERMFGLPLLAPAELEIQQVWNQTAKAYPAGTWVHDFPARFNGDATALVFDDRRVSYQEFDVLVGRLAAHLMERGVGPEALVAVFLERSIELVVALHAIMRAGGAYVPLDPNYPADRVAYMLEDSGAALVLTTTRQAAQLPRTGAAVVRVDALPAVSSHPVRPVLHAENAAYMIYTSGSTGRPKGAVNTHAGVLNRLQWMQAALPLTPADRVLQKTPCSFDVSVWEFFWPLMTGATLVVAPPQAHQDPVQLIALIGDERITTLHFVPSMLRALIDTPGVERCTSLRQIICSGEELPRDLALACQAKLPLAALHNLYGPTEAAVDVTWHACDREVSGAVPIGRPIANLTVQVLDSELQSVPAGVPGEIYLAGIGLGRGYHGRPDLTAERWLPHPLPGYAGERIYRTGDLGRWRENGEVEYLGRVDFQVKLRGFRIELGEIDAALRIHPQVADAVTALRNDAGIGPRLVGYIVPRTMPIDLAELRESLGKRLPDYMVPTAWALLTELPLSPAGKVDRRSLPAPAMERQAIRVAPRDADEALVATIWGEVLARADIGATDDFFALGGHSLLATQVMVRLRERGGITLPLRILFEEPTVERLARAVVAARAQLAPVPAPVLRRIARPRRDVAVNAAGETLNG